MYHWLYAPVAGSFEIVNYLANETAVFNGVDISAAYDNLYFSHIVSGNNGGSTWTSKGTVDC